MLNYFYCSLTQFSLHSRIKKIILNYNKHKSIVLKDFLHLLNNKISYVLNYSSIVVLKIKYVLLLHLFNVKPKRR